MRTQEPLKTEGKTRRKPLNPKENGAQVLGAELSYKIKKTRKATLKCTILARDCLLASKKKKK